MLLDIFFLQ